MKVYLHLTNFFAKNVKILFSQFLRFSVKTFWDALYIAILELITILSFVAGYPERLDLKPVGPRDPPAHFQRKQEYL